MTVQDPANPTPEFLEKLDSLSQEVVDEAIPVHYLILSIDHGKTVVFRTRDLGLVDDVIMARHLDDCVVTAVVEDRNTSHYYRLNLDDAKGVFKTRGDISQCKVHVAPTGENSQLFFMG